MLRCLTIESVVARPGVDGPHPVQFRPLCSFCSAAGTRQGFTAPFQFISFIDWDILNVGRKSASVSYILNTPSWRTDIGGPGMIRLANVHPLKKIGIDLVIRPVGRQPRLRIDGRNPHQTHQTTDSFPVHRKAMSPKPGRHPPRPVKRMFRVLFVDQPHQPQVLFVFPIRLVVKGRLGQGEKLALPRNGDLRVHRLNLFPLLHDRSD